MFLNSADRAQFWSALMQERELSLALDINPSLHAYIGPDRFVTAFDNLISNAIDAAPAKTSITIVAESVQGFVVVHVVDYAKG
jgi:signal transduction histidine kinase